VIFLDLDFNVGDSDFTFYGNGSFIYILVQCWAFVCRHGFVKEAGLKV
jgi:hypothetical protein